jgi:hypothetical protein
MNEGTVLRAPCSVASATWGFVAGLLPPLAGNAWHCAQLLPLKMGPRPEPASPAIVPETESISANTVDALKKNDVSAELNPAKGPPAPAAPCRTPGSVCALSKPAVNKMVTATRVIRARIFEFKTHVMRLVS